MQLLDHAEKPKKKKNKKLDWSNIGPKIDDKGQKIAKNRKAKGEVFTDRDYLRAVSQVGARRHSVSVMPANPSFVPVMGELLTNFFSLKY